MNGEVSNPSPKCGFFYSPGNFFLRKGARKLSLSSGLSARNPSTFEIEVHFLADNGKKIISLQEN